MRRELRHLRIVAAAADAGSFSAAANRLGVEVSAVSRGVRDLEDELGVSLFERRARGVTLTDAGRAYATSAKTLPGAGRTELVKVQPSTGSDRSSGKALASVA